MMPRPGRLLLYRFPEDPEGCIACGAMAGCCSLYPHCPGTADWKPMDRNIAVFTSASHPYPEYVSINERDGLIEIAVRSPATGPDSSHCGATSAMRMTREQFAALLKEANERLWLGPGVTYPCGCRSSGPRYEPPWYCPEHNRSASVKASDG